jgi:hypothetical protein
VAAYARDMVSRKLVVRGAIVVAVGLVALLVTPYAFWLGDGGGVAFEYGAEELRPMVEGEWRLELAENADASEPAAVMRVAFAWSHKALQARAPGGRGGWIREAAACSQRSLVRPAHACLDTTELVIDVVLDGVPLKEPGRFVAYGTRFEGGQVSFARGEQYFSASVDKAGVMRDAAYGRRIGTLTRVR